MKDLIGYYEKYKEKMNMADFALLKTALISFGVLGGLLVPKAHRKKAAVTACAVYSISIVPIMAKFLGVVLENSKPADEDQEQGAQGTD